MGEVLLYACSPESGPCPGVQLTQRLQCCGSAVTCATWMDSGKCVSSILDSLSKCGGMCMYIHMCARGMGNGICGMCVDVRSGSKL